MLEVSLFIANTVFGIVTIFTEGGFKGSSAEMMLFYLQPANRRAQLAYLHTQFVNLHTQPASQEPTFGNLAFKLPAKGFLIRGKYISLQTES